MRNKPPAHVGTHPPKSTWRMAAFALAAVTTLSGFGSAHSMTSHVRSAAHTPSRIHPSGYLTAKSLRSNSQFGDSVASSENGSVVAVGAGGIGTGRVFVYQRPGSNWPASSHPSAVLKEPLPRPGDAFGSHVALSQNGATLLVSAFNGYSGTQVFVFVRHGKTWTSNQRPAAVLTYSHLRPGGQFGTSIALSGDGQRAVVSQISLVKEAQRDGVLLVYREGKTGWHSTGTPSARLLGDGGLGQSIAISQEGTTVAGADVPTGACSYGLRKRPSGNLLCGAGAIAIYTEPVTGWHGTVYATAALSPVPKGYGLSSSFGGVVGIISDGLLAMARDYANVDLLFPRHDLWNRHAGYHVFSAPAAQSADGNFDQPTTLSASGTVIVAGVLLHPDVAYVYRRHHAAWISRTRPDNILVEPKRSQRRSGCGSMALASDGGTVFVGGTAPGRVEIYALN